MRDYKFDHLCQRAIDPIGEPPPGAAPPVHVDSADWHPAAMQNFCNEPACPTNPGVTPPNANGSVTAFEPRWAREGHCDAPARLVERHQRCTRICVRDERLRLRSA
jgi:hypothetical protein